MCNVYTPDYGLLRGWIITAPTNHIWEKWEPRSTQSEAKLTSPSIQLGSVMIFYFNLLKLRIWTLGIIQARQAPCHRVHWCPWSLCPWAQTCPQETFSSPVSFGVVLKIILCLCQPHPEGPCYLGVRIVFKKIRLPFIWRSACLRLLLSSLDR